MEVHTSGEYVEPQGTEKCIFLIDSTIEKEILVHGTGGERRGSEGGGRGREGGGRGGVGKLDIIHTQGEVLHVRERWTLPG